MRWKPDNNYETLTPLPPKLHSGLIAISILASMSFVITSGLFLYLTFKLIVWYFRPLKPRRSTLVEIPPDPRIHPPASTKQANDFVLGIDGIFTEGEPRSPATVSTVKKEKLTRSPPNQFLILIYNLLLADMHQSVAFALNGSWLRANGIIVETKACFAQGLFVSTGDLSSSLFITTIAVHTYLSVVKGYRPPHYVIYFVVFCVWAFVYLISALPIITTNYGVSVGGYFVRAGAWCWVNEAYERHRLFTHYLFIFFGLTTTTVLYVAIYIHLRRRRRRISDTSASHSYHPAFLLYPIIYVACTLPLAAGRISTMAGADVPVGYFCFAGAIISCNGFFDCLLFGTTRNTIIFANSIDAQDTGLDTFAFLQTPSNRRFGNMIWVQGGGGSRRKLRQDSRRTTSQESLQQAIQLDMVTSVVVERDHRGIDDAAYAASVSPSFVSSQMAVPKYH